MNNLENKFETVKSDTKNKKRKAGDKLINVHGKPIKYGFFVHPSVERSMRNVSYIIAEDWQELQLTVCDHFDLVSALDFPEETARKIFDSVVFNGATSFEANGKQFLVRR